MIPFLSINAFKFLRSISRKLGLECSDEEIHDMGIRLLTLCEIVVKGEEERVKAVSIFTVVEAEGLKAIQEHYAAKGNIPSARTLSRLLGYRSSRSGHLLLQRFLDRGILIRRGSGLALKQNVARE